MRGEALIIQGRITQILTECSRCSATGRASHFVLLSAICVQKPRLAFQQAKLAFEQTLKNHYTRVLREGLSGQELGEHALFHSDKK